MKKRLVAFLLVLIMVLGMLPVSAFAADDGVSPQALESNETQTIKYQILYVGDEFNIGYNYGASVNKTYTCQYSTGHSGFNHSILISEFRNVGVPALKGQLDSGYEFVGWAKEAKKNPTIFDFNTAGTTATQTTYTIYLVAKKTNPTPTYMYYLYYKYNDGTDSTWLTDVTDRPTAATTFTFNVNRAKLTRSGYDHIGWADKADAVTAKYTGGDPIVLTKDNPTKTIYAIWMPFFELKYDANGGTGAPASQTRTAAHPTVNRVTFTVPNQTPSKEGYTFKGWADSSTATTAQYQPGGTIAVNHADSPKTVYAVWEKNAAPIEYTVTYYKNDGSANDLFYKTSDWGEPSEKFNIYWGKPTRDGYDFVGWAETRDATEAKYASGGAGGKQSWIKLDGPKVLYAVWQEAGLEPEAPRSPSDCKDQLKTNTIKLVCVDGNHPDKVITFADVSYGLDWSMGDTCRLNFYAKDAALKYSGHAPKNPEERIYVTFKWVNNETDANGKYLPGKWVMDETTAAVVKLVDTGVEAPSKPTTAQLGNIKVTCRTNAEHSSEFPVAKCMGTTVGTVTFDSVKKQWYIDTAPMTTQLASRYDSWKGYAEGTHRLVNPDAKLNARFYYDGEKWYTEDTLAIDVCCGAVSEIPGKPDMNQFLGNVLIRCTTDGSTHAEKGRKNIYSNTRDSSMYTEVLDGNGDAIWKDNGGVWTYQIKLIRAKFVEAYSNNRFIKYPHTDTAPNEETILTWKYKNGAWELIKLPGYTEVATIIEVKCAEIKEPTRDDIFGALNGLVTVTCINRFWKDGNNNMDCGQGQYAAKAGIVGQEYTLVKGEDDTTWVVTFPVTNFVKSFKQNPAHNLYSKNTLSWYIRWKDNAWTSAPVEPGVDDLVKLTHAPTDWREVAKIATGGKSDCIHVSCVNGETGVCDYGITVPFVYSATDVVSVEPEDGVPGSYIATFKVDRYIDTCAKACNDKNFKDAPRTHKLLTQDTVQWRLYATSEADEKIGNNVLNHVWAADPVTPGTDDVCTIAHNWVVTFDPNNGEPAFTQNVEYEGKATEPTPAPEKEGYAFTGWYLDEAEEPFSFDTTITSDITLTAKWHVTLHNIYAYARLNSYFAPLTTSEFDTPVTLNEATLSRLGLGSYNSLGYISIGSFTFDAMPLTSDLYFGDDAELSAVAEKLATDIALETGVSDKIVEKIAWTALYKTVNEEDMEPGYPAEAGYQLSGNLNLASVTFRAGAENVENMPAVNYTYDDGAIDFYDFYFAGDTITLPTTEPTREGYSFKGWSVEVIPAENDADHLDADGADDAADETLLKAGDTYTITAGGVIFTAQWEKKTFTVKYYLPDETGAWVEKKMDTVDSVDYATYSLWTPNAEDGYEFSGWYQKPADIGVKAKVEKLYMAKEWKLYGKFTPIEYTIQYVYNDGKATSTNPTTYTVESDTITLADATGADWGKTFLEWHDENGQKITEIPTGSTGDRVITAYWNWPVHLHYLDKDNNEIESATLYVSELEPGACVLPTGEKTGYDFDGWYEAKKDIGTASHKLNALSIAKKWELYGRYTAKTDVSYTVKYLREGDNKVLAPEKVVTDQTFDTEVTEQAADVVGYTPDAPSKTMILDEYNKVLTFSYSANTYDYTVRHIKQLPDGSYDEANAEVETLSGKFEALAAVTAKDYGSHYPTNDADTKQNIKIEKGLTIDVKYDLDEHTLTFETNGGSAINPVTVRHGNAVARPADPTKDKYTFIGWYADPEFTEEYDFATVLEADKTIYAKFELTSTPIGDIYVRYDVLHIKQLPDGTYDLANAEVEHLSAKKDTTVTAVIKDYRATHHVNVNRTLSKLTGTAIQPYKGVDGKPVYTILSVYYDLDFHTLTFDTMGGSKIAPETVRHGLTVAKPKDPVNGGYIFDGWYTDKTYRTPYNFATPLTQDTTIYAKWFLIVLPGVTVKKNTPKLNTADHFAYVQGYPDGTVKPAGNITRAETAAILFRLMDDASRKTYYSTKSGFRDVASGSWYNTYVATLNNAGVITDSSNGYFRPNEAITRAELAAMLAKFSETTGAANYFNDVSAKYWAANAIAICAKLGWITGYPDGTFRPDKNVTRAELMAMINRATGRAPKSADAFLPGMKTWSDNTADKWYYLDVQEATNSHSYTVKGSETWTALTSDPNWSLYE